MRDLTDKIIDMILSFHDEEVCIFEVYSIDNENIETIFSYDCLYFKLDKLLKCGHKFLRFDSITGQGVIFGGFVVNVNKGTVERWTLK